MFKIFDRTKSPKAVEVKTLGKASRETKGFHLGFADRFSSGRTIEN